MNSVYLLVIGFLMGAIVWELLWQTLRHYESILIKEQGELIAAQEEVIKTACGVLGVDVDAIKASVTRERAS